MTVAEALELMFMFGFFYPIVADVRQTRQKKMTSDSSTFSGTTFGGHIIAKVRLF